MSGLTPDGEKVAVCCSGRNGCCGPGSACCKSAAPHSHAMCTTERHDLAAGEVHRCCLPFHETGPCDFVEPHQASGHVRAGTCPPICSRCDLPIEEPEVAHTSHDLECPRRLIGYCGCSDLVCPACCVPCNTKAALMPAHKCARAV